MGLELHQYNNAIDFSYLIFAMQEMQYFCYLPFFY